jgi:hypothetical protein
LTRASIEKSASFKPMDCRVKPGNDGGWGSSDSHWYTQKRVNHRKVQQAPHPAIIRLARDAADRAGNTQRNPCSTETRPCAPGRSRAIEG